MVNSNTRTCGNIGVNYITYLTKLLNSYKRVKFKCKTLVKTVNLLLYLFRVFFYAVESVKCLESVLHNWNFNVISMKVKCKTLAKTLIFNCIYFVSFEVFRWSLLFMLCPDNWNFNGLLPKLITWNDRIVTQVIQYSCVNGLVLNDSVKLCIKHTYLAKVCVLAPSCCQSLALKSQLVRVNKLGDGEGFNDTNSSH